MACESARCDIFADVSLKDLLFRDRFFDAHCLLNGC
jgi:hypothetical protein